MRGIVKIYAAAGFYTFAQLCLFRASVASFRGQASVLKFYKFTRSSSFASSVAMDRAF